MFKYQNNKQNRPLYSNLNENISYIEECLGKSSDVVFRQFKTGNTNAVLIFIEGLSDGKIINEHVLGPLMVLNQPSPLTPDIISNHLIHISQVNQSKMINTLIEGCLAGDSVLILDHHPKALLLNTRGFETRSIKEPDTEVVVRGPKEGFTEKLQTNTSLIRRKLKNQNLIFESLTLGSQTSTTVYIAYLKNIAKHEVVQEVRKRVSNIKIDSILESGYIEQLIEDAPFSPFPTISNSEKPDIVAAKLLEGRVAILVDGTPVVLIVPKLFVESFQNAEDYYSRPYYVSLVRILRFLAFFITTMGPGIYVALSTFHQELIPTNLLFSMASAREGTPFPAVFEAIGMGAIYEILREAGIRLPRPVGSAVSIVGALVIGEAAVSAGLISAPLIIVIALTAISSFVVTSIADIATLLRLLFTIFAGFMGLFGMSIIFLGILVHLCSLKSFGTPYLFPLAPLNSGGLLDIFIRAPLQALVVRPTAIANKFKKRQ